jgi:membrane-associated phospholipid phosphatase
MPTRARMALTGAAVGVALLTLTWYASHYVGVVRRADVSILSGFVQLDRPGLDRLTNFVAGLCSPKTYVWLALVPILLALTRRRPRVAVMLGLVLLCANETTQLLKPLLAAPRNPVPWDPVDLASWPSGHATAAMSLALCVVIAAPARRRPVVAVTMSAFALAVCYSFLELSWHYPSDVFGGFLVAATWTLLGVAALTIYEARRASPRPEPRRPPAATVSVTEALSPVVMMIAVAAVLFGLILVARPHQVIAYARDHEVFVIGTCAIGALGVTLASGLTLLLRRGSPHDGESA